MSERLHFEIEQACRALRDIDKGHLSDAVVELYKSWKQAQEELTEANSKYDKIMALIDKFYER